LVTRERFVDRIRKTVGFDRVLFGSDYPAVNGVSIESMIAEVKNSDYLRREEKENILGLNAMRLLDLR
jgi:predicted TIM-barrel fold metal-dependent hydrolase